jgi:hypothetical protein
MYVELKTPTIRPHMFLQGMWRVQSRHLESSIILLIQVWETLDISKPPPHLTPPRWQCLVMHHFLRNRPRGLLESRSVPLSVPQTRLVKGNAPAHSKPPISFLVDEIFPLIQLGGGIGTQEVLDMDSFCQIERRFHGWVSDHQSLRSVWVLLHYHPVLYDHLRPLGKLMGLVNYLMTGIN